MEGQIIDFDPSAFEVDSSNNEQQNSTQQQDGESKSFIFGDGIENEVPDFLEDKTIESNESEIEEGLDNESDEVSNDEEQTNELHEIDQFIQFKIDSNQFEALTVDEIIAIRNQYEDPKEAFYAIERKEKEVFADKYIQEKFINERLSPEVRLMVEAELSGVDLNEYRQLESAYNQYRSITDQSYNDENITSSILAEKILSNMAAVGKSITYEAALEKAMDSINRDPEYSEVEARRFVAETTQQLEDRLRNIFPESEKRKMEKEQSERLEVEQFPVKIQEKLYKTTEIFKGIPLTDIARENIVKTITHPFTEENGNLYNYMQYLQKRDPELFVARLAYLANAGVFDENIGVDKLVQIANSTKNANKLQTQNNGVVSKVISSLQQSNKKQQVKKSSKENITKNILPPSDMW